MNISTTQFKAWASGKWIRISENIPPEQVSEDGIGTRKSLPVLVLFLKNQDPGQGGYYRVAYFDSLTSKWIVPISVNDEDENQHIIISSTKTMWKKI
jgi:hypothetical protein